MMILVVEDNDSIREALSEGLRLRGHHVHAVGTMAAARDAIKHLRIQGVITDGIFPGHDVDRDIAMWGLDVMALAWLEHIPAVLVSGENVLVLEARARGHRALVKPASVEQILDALEAERQGRET